MLDLPLYISVVFILTTLLTIFIFYKATNNSATTLLILLLWIALQAFVSLSGFYTVANTIPPRFAFLVLPAVLFIVGLFITAKGKIFIDGLDLQKLTILHVVRFPVELVLYWLFLSKKVPQLMTFEGRNFDILAGLSAPLIYYFVFVKTAIGKRGLLLWNIICLGLLINIVFNAVLSAPFPFQQFGFDQPNIAILYFPFVWLPCCVVPLVLTAHLAAIRKLIKE